MCHHNGARADRLHRGGAAPNPCPMRWFATLLVKLILGFVALSLLLVVVFRFVPVPVTATMLMDENGITKDWEPLSDIDRNLVRAAIAAEDGKFCSHNGFDQEAIENAIRSNREGGRIRGGSTISQQTAKNVFLWQGGGYFRKGLEAWFTFLIENIWGKRRIMEWWGVTGWTPASTNRRWGRITDIRTGLTMLTDTIMRTGTLMLQRISAARS